MLNLKVTPSSLFIPPENPAAAAAGGEEEEGGEAGEVIEMNWHCKAGMAANINLVKEEFAKARGLRPVKIFITGPPCSGKTFFGQQLGEHYNVPHIHMEKLLSDLASWDQEKEENFHKRQAEREKLIAKIKAERAAEKERLRKAKEEELKRKRELANEEEGEEGAEDKEGEEENPPAEGEGEGGAGEAGERPMSQPEQEEPINVTVEGDSDEDFAVIEIKEKVKAFLAEGGESRIPAHLINEAVRWRLNRNDCQNRGYVLDGYPKNAQSASEVFIITPTKPVKQAVAEGEEGEEPPAEEEETALKPVLQTNIYPESVISLNASALFLKRRSAHLQAHQMSEGLKWHTAKLVEKLKAYNADNAIDLFKQENSHPSECECVYPTTKFFQDHKTEIFEMEADGEKYEMFESMRIYIERFGRPYNYLKSVKELNEEREKHLIEEEKATKAEQEAGSSKDQEALATQKAALEKLFEQRLTHVKAHMAELCDCDDLNMRQFLMKYIIPVLTEGMIDVWKHGPLDPVDYLAEYIFKRSNGT